MASQESNCPGSRSPFGNRFDCAKTDGTEGRRLKLTMSAPVPLRNCLRVMSMAFIVILPQAACPDARLTARRIRICVPQRHRLPAKAVLIWLSVGLGVLSSRALVDMIMPLIQ